MHKLQELIDLVRKCRANCPWCKEQTFEQHLEQVFSEAEELKEEVKRKDSEGIKEELGDLVWDVMMLLHIAEHRKMLDPDEVIGGVIEKMKRRKPYIVNGETVTIEEAMRIWNEEKAKEKTQRGLRQGMKDE